MPPCLSSSPPLRGLMRRLLRGACYGVYVVWGLLPAGGAMAAQISPPSLEASSDGSAYAAAAAGAGNRLTVYSSNDLMTDLQANAVRSVVIDGLGHTQVWRGNDPQPYVLSLPPTRETVELLRQHQIPFRVVSGESGFAWVGQVLPLLLTGLILLLMWRSLQGSREGVGTQFGKTRARAVQPAEIKLGFADVAGCEEAKADLQEVVDFLRSPQKYHQLGARIPRGVLLVGPPGSGKTLLTKAVAGEAGVPYFSISGSDFVEMFVGVGAARVRDLFEQARKHTPCIIFIDEIDAVGRQRGHAQQGGNDEREQTLNQLLVEMDGFEQKQDVIILAATNRPDVLDAALLRAGRFDRQVVVDAPDVRGREQILQIHARNKPLSAQVDLSLLARRTAGMVGADLENVLNEAALLAARSGRSEIEPSDLDEARDRVLMGPERRSMVIAQADRLVTAYHEVGHALAAHLLPHAHGVAKLTVVPRGRAAGFMLPESSDQLHVTRSALQDMLAVALAGRAAEEVVYGEVTTGAQNDFQQASAIARRMVTEWGMSALGKVALASEQESYLGRASQLLPMSEATAAKVDAEIRALIDEAYARAMALIREHLPQMHEVVEELMQRETLSGEEFAALLCQHNGAT